MNNLVSNISITSRAVTALNELEEEFASIYSKRDFTNMIEIIKSVKDESAKRANYLPTLYEMLDDCEIGYRKGQDISYYESLVENEMKSERYGAVSIEERMVFAIFEKYQSFAEPAKYMERIVTNLINEEDAKKWGNDSLRTKILKQFIKYGNYLENAGYTGRTTIEKRVKAKTGLSKSELTPDKVADIIGEDEFDVIDNPDIKADEKKVKYSLLKLADDLAKGRFRTNGATKKGLYLFAMVYNMTLPGFPDNEENRDLIKQLFRDYYTNNLMIYLDEDYRKRLCEFETDPSGQGVNYKNFAEMIFLYFIAKNITPQERIEKSYAMINEVTEKAKNHNKNEHIAPIERDTKYFKEKILIKRDLYDDEIFSEKIFEKNEEEFMQFILDNYNCDTRTGKAYKRKGQLVEGKISPIAVELDQNTAYRIYLDLLNL